MKITYITGNKAKIDLAKQFLEPLGFMIDGKKYANYLDNRELSSEDFYNLIKDGKVAKTSQVNPEQFYRVFKEITGFSPSDLPNNYRMDADLRIYQQEHFDPTAQASIQL